MRAALLYSIYSGHLFFIAIALFAAVALSDIAGMFERRERLRRIAAFFALLAIPLGLFSAPPMPWWHAGIMIISTSLYLFRGFAHHSRRAILGGIAVLSCIGAFAAELPFHVAAERPARPTELFVIGDSLAAGGFGEEVAWPELFGRQSGIRVWNLSLASSDVAMALERQLPQLPPPRGRPAVLIAVGGNDMLHAADTNRFREDLDRLLTVASAGRRRDLVVLELPLLPGRWQYGAVQRELARSHRAFLIPKRVLAGALVGRGNTSDALHLTQQGHADLAGRITAWWLD